MKYASVVATLTVASLGVAACGSAADEANPPNASDPGLFMACAESRGSLHELQQMLGGSKRVDTSTLEHGAGMLTQLAGRVSASDDVRASLDRWKQAVTKWRDQLRAMQPRIENGRLIEPDTSALDRELMEVLQAVNKPLVAWVTETCEGVQL